MMEFIEYPDEISQQVKELMRRMSDMMERDESLDDLDMDELMANGFSPEDISSALMLLTRELIPKFEKRRVVEQKRKTGEHSYRMLRPAERALFSVEAYGDLIDMQTNKVLNGAQVESIIEYCILLGESRLSRDELMEIVTDLVLIPGVGKRSKKLRHMPPGGGSSSIH